ncbi:MAG: galactokinase [Phycisphaerales bacterium]
MLDSIPDSVHPLLDGARTAFATRFEREPTLAAAAPGRVNLIGEHTDYNDGFVLPVAIDRWVVAVGAPFDELDPNAGSTTSGIEPLSTIVSLDFDEAIGVDLTEPVNQVDALWANYILGPARMLQRRGDELVNLEAAFTSSVPIGAGLSSSAALEVAAMTLFEQAANLEVDPIEKAQMCQVAEHIFAGVPCGLMDQLISSLGRAGHAMLIDCRSHEIDYAPLPPADEAVLLIADTNVRHALAENDYAERRRQCAAAVSAISEALGEKIESLRDVDEAMLDRAAPQVEGMLVRRARHVVQENRRTLDAVEALRGGDLVRFGTRMFESHDSLRDAYEVSCPELDALVDLAGEFSESITGKDRGVFGARMTGGGFGGCVIALVRPDAVPTVTNHLTAGFRARYETSPTIFTTPAVSGAIRIGLE